MRFRRQVFLLAAVSVLFGAGMAVFARPPSEELQRQQLQVLVDQKMVLDSMLVKLDSQAQGSDFVQMRDDIANINREIYVTQIFLLIGLGGFLCGQFFGFVNSRH